MLLGREVQMSIWTCKNCGWASNKEEWNQCWACGSPRLKIEDLTIEQLEMVRESLPLIREEYKRQMVERKKTADQVMEWVRSQMMPCPHCGQDMSKEALYCPHCGKSPKKKTWPLWLRSLISASMITVGIAYFEMRDPVLFGGYFNNPVYHYLFTLVFYWLVFAFIMEIVQKIRRPK
jgi:ribosomal protein L37E